MTYLHNKENTGLLADKMLQKMEPSHPGRFCRGEFQLTNTTFIFIYYAKKQINQKVNV
jgi:hypothetical protein